MKKVLFYSGLIVVIGFIVFSCNKDQFDNPVTQQENKNDDGNYKSASIEEIYLKDIEQSDGSINDVHMEIINNPHAIVQTQLIITKTVPNPNSPQVAEALSGLILDKSLTVTKTDGGLSFTIPYDGKYWMISDNGEIVEKLAGGGNYDVLCHCISILGPNPYCELKHTIVTSGATVAYCDYLGGCGKCLLQAILVGGGKKINPFIIIQSEKIKVNGKIYE